MRALKIEAQSLVAFHEVAEPVPGPGEVLVSVRHVGLCGSDLATFNGLNPLVSLPRIPGHEIGGVVEAAGADVPADYAPGRHVIVIPYTACGKCPSCRRGRVNACRSNRTLGVQQEGGLTEKIVLPYEKLILNDTLPAHHLALVEPLSVGFHAVARGNVAAGQKVAVLGCGMIGMGAVIAAVARGAEVIAIDYGDKPALARRFGAAHGIDAASDVASAVNDLTNGDGADVVIEAVGLPATFTQAVDLACFCGQVVYIGYCKAQVSYETRFFNMKELDIHGSRNALAEDFTAAAATLEKLGTKADALISKVFPFSEADAALSYWAKHRKDIIKILIER